MKSLNFREFVDRESPRKEYADIEVANLYFHNRLKIKELSELTGKSIGEIYRVIRTQGEPNRRRTDQGNVIALADSGLSLKTVSELTGYSTRHVRNILKNS
jgi:predicted DNA-binding transcriptional regulator AlpA